MRTSTRARRIIAAFATAALVITGSVATASAANAAISPVGITKMAALGDSITTALMSCSSILSGCPANSWSTGSNTAVASHLQKINAANGAAPAPTGYNDAVTGVLAAGLNAQAIKAVGQGAQYVTIEIGANDACTKTTALMTDPGVFGGQVSTALTTLANGKAPELRPQVFVASVPDLKNMWSINYKNSSARFTWGLLKICQSMLANPSSVLPADNARRDLVQQRVIAYNAQLAAACSAYGPNCTFDNNKVFDTKFTSQHISTRDYFHPSVAGQRLLADQSWLATQWVAP